LERSIKKNFLNLSFNEVEVLMAEFGWKRYRASQIISWIYKRNAACFEEMTDLSRDDRMMLSESFRLSHLKISNHQKSLDGTEKFLFRLEDGKQIETVLIREENRLTLCISSQAGCTLDCTFCLTAQEKLKRNLRVGEIINQILTVQTHLSEAERITNVVLMGMGEPLANLAAVTESLMRMISPVGFHLSPRRITVSTAGLVPQMKKFWQSPAPVNLSISLNATTDFLRNKLMPKVNALYPLAELLSVCRSAPLSSRRSITFEYILLSGINDSLEDADRLVQITRGIRCKINLIPFNRYPGALYYPSSEDQTLRFQNHLLQSKLRTTLRKSKGRDILAACGQLSGLHSSVCS